MTESSGKVSALGLDDARLSVLLDFRHPLAYLALHPTIEFALEVGIEINWLPVQVPPLREPTTPGPEDDRGLRHRRHRAQAIAREIRTYSAVQGIELRELYRDPDPGLAFAAWLWVRSESPARLTDFLVDLFRQYWTLELDPGDLAGVAGLVEGIGCDPVSFSQWARDAGSATAAGLAEALAQRGLSGAPLYLLEGEVFLGRQHFPMLEWVLAGRPGPGPI